MWENIFDVNCGPKAGEGIGGGGRAEHKGSMARTKMNSERVKGHCWKGLAGARSIGSLVPIVGKCSELCQFSERPLQLLPVRLLLYTGILLRSGNSISAICMVA